MKLQRITLIAVSVSLLAWAPALGADALEFAGDRSRDDAAAPAEAAKPKAAAPQLDLSPPIYVPPSRNAPRARVGGATRGIDPSRPAIEVLAPQSLGHTLEPQPVLYWFLAEPTEQRIVFTVTTDASVEPLLETALEPPKRPGVQRIRLADHGLRLETGVDYQWFVAITGDGEPRASAQVAGGGIARVDAPRDLKRKLAAEGEDRRAYVLADGGIWYDALAAISQQIDAAPENLRLRHLRIALLEQVGLDGVARTERANADAESRKRTEGSVSLPVYVPPKPVRASYPRHLTGLGARGPAMRQSGIRLFALAPNHLGVTVRGQPTFYWYLEQDSDLPVEFTLIDGNASDPLLEITFEPPLRAGYHAVPLAEHGFRLESGTIYEWTAALVTGGREVHPTISVGFVERREPDPDLESALAEAGAAGAVHVYASRGLWYEAFDAVSRRAAADPRDPAPHLQRAALLDQVDLSPVGDHSRLAASSLRHGFQRSDTATTGQAWPE